MYQRCFYCGFQLVIWLHKIAESANLFQLFYELCRHIVYVIWLYHVQNELIAWWPHCANIFLEHEAYSFVKEGVNKFWGLLYDSKLINLSWQMSTKFFIICLLGVLCVKFFAGSYNWKYIFINNYGSIICLLLLCCLQEAAFCWPGKSIFESGQSS